jgi:heat-inducible transcriptional repressor
MSHPVHNLSERQRRILTRVVSEYIATGHPVGSKWLVEAGGVDASPSTVRYELAELEARGLLGHPHTSAGRVPTDAGYRLYAESLLDQPLGVARLPVELGAVRTEIDSALRTTTEMLSHVTSLLALVTAPRLETTEIRHVEVLLLQPHVVMVVVITSTGGVTKKLFPFPAPVDPKLAEWARTRSSSG